MLGAVDVGQCEVGQGGVQVNDNALAGLDVHALEAEQSLWNREFSDQNCVTCEEQSEPK